MHLFSQLLPAISPLRSILKVALLLTAITAVAPRVEAQSCTTLNYVGCNSYVVSNILCRINAYRTQNGLAKLTADPRLVSIATSNVQLNVQTYLQYGTPYVHSPAEWYTNAGFTTWGENVYWAEVWGSTAYWGPYASSKAASVWWWNSPPHRANILNGNFNRIGVACVKYYNPANGHYRFYYTTAFGRV